MEKEFSIHWQGSRQPRKQRKFIHNAPLHIRHKLMSSNLSKDLRKKYGKRSFPLRKDDKVIIMVGENKKKTGKIETLDLKRYRVTLGEIKRTKKDGTKIPVYFHPSNLQIIELNLSDKKRIEALNRKATPKKTAKAVNENKSKEKKHASTKK